MITGVLIALSNAPLPLVTLKLKDCEGLVVFRSRKVEDGRERHRLHLGYFDTERAAQAALPQVREEYPEFGGLAMYHQPALTNLLRASARRLDADKM